MTVTRHVLVAMLFTFGHASAVSAQDSCSAVLSNVHDTNLVVTSTEYYKSVKQQACSNSSTAQQVNGAIVFESLPISLGASQSQTDAWCSGSEAFEYLDQRFSQLIKTVNSTVIQAWSDCMKRPGAQISIMSTGDPSQAILSLAYIKLNTNDNTPLIKSLDLSNLECPTAPKNNSPIDALQRHACTRPDVYVASTAILNIPGAPSPGAAIIKPIPAPIVPEFNMTGLYSSSGLGKIGVKQSGRTFTFKYKEAAIDHNFIGTYIGPTKVVGIQSRHNEQLNTNARMYLELLMVSGTQFCSTTARLEPPDKPQPEFPANWVGKLECNNKE